MSIDTDTVECHFQTVKEAFMGGWKSKKKINEKKNARNFTDLTKGGAPPGKKPSRQSLQARNRLR